MDQAILAGVYPESLARPAQPLGRRANPNVSRLWGQSRTRVAHSLHFGYPVTRSTDHLIPGCGCYNPTVFRHALTTLFLLAAACMAQQQQPPAPQQSPSPQQPDGKPQVKVNYLNVCTPGTDEQAVINGALAVVQPK